MASRLLATLGGPVWIADQKSDRLKVSPIPIIVLLCGMVAPMLLARLDLPASAHSDQTPYDRHHFWTAQAQETPFLDPLLAAAQIKRVAAVRQLPYFVVRRLVDDNTLDKNGVDIAALNLALDRYQRSE